ncbi:hypothetical protein ACWCP6_07390 [Streptomyces sp. NPDC002004]
MAADRGSGAGEEHDATVALRVDQEEEVPEPADPRTPSRVYAVVSMTVRRNRARAGEAAAGRGARTGAPPVATVLLISHASSMVSRAGRMAAARTAALAALERLPDGAEFAVVACSDRTETVYPATGDGFAVAGGRTRREAAEALRRHAPGGGTAMGLWLDHARRLFERIPADRRDGCVRHALLLTDSGNDPAYETPEQLRGRIDGCRSLFQCDVVGIGDAWESPELLGVTEALEGQARTVEDLARLPEALTELTAQALSRDVTGLRLRLRLGKDVTLHSVERVHPSRVALWSSDTDLTAVHRGAGGPVQWYDTGPWGEEHREYLLSATAPFRPSQRGVRLLLASVGVDRAGSGSPRVRLPAPAGVHLRWGGAAHAAPAGGRSRNPRVQHYRDEQALRDAFEAGCAALQAGERRAAETHFGRAWSLAAAVGNADMRRHLRGLVRVLDSEQGEVRLRSAIPKLDLAATRVQASMSVRWYEGQEP